MTNLLHPLRVYRQAKSPPMPLEELAQAVGVTKASLSRIETGKQVLTFDLAVKLSKETGLSMRVLFPELAGLLDGEAAE